MHGGGGTLLPLIEVCLGDSIMGCNFFWDWTPKQKMTDTSLRLSRRVFGWESCGAIHFMVVGKISCQQLHRLRINQTNFLSSLKVQILSIARHRGRGRQRFVC